MVWNETSRETLILYDISPFLYRSALGEWAGSFVGRVQIRLISFLFDFIGGWVGYPVLEREKIKSWSSILKMVFSSLIQLFFLGHLIKKNGILILSKLFIINSSAYKLMMMEEIRVKLEEIQSFFPS